MHLRGESRSCYWGDRHGQSLNLTLQSLVCMRLVGVQRITMLQKIPLYILLSVLFSVQVLGITGAVGYLSYQGGQQAVEQLADEWMTEIDGRVDQHLNDFLTKAQEVNRTNVAAFRAGLLDPNDRETLGQYFYHQCRLFEFASVNFNGPDGSLVRAGRGSNPGEFNISEVARPDLETLTTYATDNQGHRLHRLRQQPAPASAPRNFERNARSGKGEPAIWNLPDRWESGPSPARISTHTPIYDAHQTLLGTLSVDVELEPISHFLQQLRGDRPGNMFILDRSGQLIASSEDESLGRGGETARSRVRLGAIEEHTPAIHPLVKALADRYGNLQAITEPQLLHLRRDSALFVSVRPSNQAVYGLDWLIVTVVPESTVLSNIRSSLRQTLWLCGLALLGTLAVGVWTAERVARPLSKFTQAIQDFAGGLPVQLPAADCIREVAILSDSFEGMMGSLEEAKRLRQNYAQTLEHQIAESTAALHERTTQLQTAQRVARVGSWELEVATRQVTWSQELFHLSGLTPHPKGSVEVHLSEIVHPDDWEQLHQAVNEAITSRKPYEVEHRVVRPDGTLRYMMSRGEVLCNEQDQVIKLAGTVADITERKQAELALQQSEAKTRAILEAIPDVMFRVGADGVFREVMADPLDLDVFFKRRNPVGCPMVELLPTDIVKRRQTCLQRALETGQLQTCEQQVQVDGRSRYEEIRVIKSGDDEVLFMIRDISDRKRIELALQQSEAKSRAVLAAIPDLMFRLSADGTYLEVVNHQNDLDLLPEGFNRVGCAARDILPADVADAYHHYIEKTLQTGNIQIYEQQVQIGARHQFEEVRIVQSGDAEVLLMIRDITERKRAERVLQQLSQELVEWRDRYDIAAQASGQVLFEYDISADCIQWGINSIEMLGYTADAMPSTIEAYIALIHPDYQAAFREFLSSPPNIDTYHMEFLFRKADGTYLWVEERGRTRFTIDGTPIQEIGYLGDISHRKRTELSLQQSESQSRAILAAIPDLMMRVGADGVFREVVNQHPEIDLHASEANRVGVAMQDLLPPDLATRHLHHVKQALATSELQHFEQAVSNGGRLQHEEVRVIKSGEDEVLIMIRDITERKQAEVALETLSQELAEWRDRYDIAARASGQILFEYDIVSNQDTWGPNTESVLGYPLEAMPKRVEDCFKFIHPDDHAVFQQVIDNDKTAKAPYRVEFRFRKADGTYVWVEERGMTRHSPEGEALQVIGYVMNIDDRKRSEQALRCSKQRYASLTAAAPVGIYQLDATGDCCVYVNERYCEITGFEAGAVMGTGWNATIHPDDHIPIAAEWTHSLRENRPFQLEYRHRRPDGTVIWVYGQAIAELDNRGQITGYVGTITDIRDRKRVEQQLRQLNEELEAKVVARTAALREREARYRALVELIPDLLIRMRPDGLYLDLLPDDSVKLFNPTKAQAGSGIYDVLPQEHAQQRLQYIRQAVETRTVQTYDYELVIEGDLRCEEARIVAIDDGEVLVIVRDITERKRAQAALERLNRELETRIVERTAELQKREAHYRALVEVIPDLLIHIRADGTYLDLIPGGNVQLLNPGYAHTGTSIYDDMPFEHARRRMEYLQLALDTREIQLYEYEIEVNASFRSEEARVIALNAEEALVIVRDISDRKQAEIALQQSEARFQTLVKNMPGMIYRYVPGKDGVGAFTYVSTGAYDLFELETDTILQDANAVWNLIHPDDLPSLQSSVAIAVQNCDAWRWEGRLTTPSGQLKWIQGNSRPQRISETVVWDGLLMDISDRKGAELALQASEERYRAIFDQVTVGINQAEPQSGRLISANRAFCDMLGYTEAEVQALTYREITHPEDLAKHQDVYQQLFAGRVPSYLHEKRYRHKAGHYVWTQINVSPLRDRDGQVISDIAVVVNIEDRKRAEEALRQSELTNRIIVETIPDLLIQMDYQGRYTRMVSSRTTQNQYLSGDITAVQVRGALSPELFEQRLYHAHLAFTQDSLQVYEQSFELDGERRFEEVRIAPLDDHEVLVIIRDITERKRAEHELQQLNQALDAKVKERTASLQEREQFLQTVLDTFPLSIFWKDRSSVFLGCNRKFLKDANLSSVSEVLGKTDYDMPWGNTEADLYRADDRLIMETGVARQGIVETLVKADGTQIWVETSKLPINDLSGSVIGVLGSYQDITERKQAEAALRESEARWQFALEGSGDGVWDWNLQTDTVFFSQQWKAMLGYSDADIGTTLDEWDSRIHPEDKVQCYADINRHFRGETDVYQNEHRVRCKDGRYKWVLDRGKVIERTAEGQPLRMIGTNTDITSRREQEQTIREQAALLDIASDAIIVKEPDQRIRYWNQGAERIYGWKASQAIGQKAHELLQIDPGTLETSRQHLLTQGEWSGEVVKVTQANKKVTVEARWTLVRDEANQPKFILSVDSDITAKKQLEAQFYQAQRLESLGRLASGIAHDLNNVLTPILTMSQLLRLTQQQSMGSQAQEQLQLLEDSAKRGSNLVKQILTFTRGSGESSRRVADMADLLREVFDITRQSFPKSIRVRSTLPEASEPFLGTVAADPTHLHQVLMNLCINASDAMPEGGQLTLTLRNEFADEALIKANRDAESRNYVVMTVADTGIGMTPEVCDRMFDPFFTTKEPGKGTGLGLSTALGIVKNYGGFLLVDTEVGQGTRIEVYLPTTDQNPTAPAANRAQPTGQGELILVVDDDEIVQRTTRSLLESNHYRTLVANDGLEAMEQYAKHQADISLVVLDIMMPNMDGIRLTERLKFMNPEVIILALSGLSANQQPVLTAGASAFLSKPYLMDELLKAIQQLIGAQHS